MGNLPRDLPHRAPSLHADDAQRNADAWPARAERILGRAPALPSSMAPARGAVSGGQTIWLRVETRPGLGHSRTALVAGRPGRSAAMPPQAQTGFVANLPGLDAADAPADVFRSRMGANFSPGRSRVKTRFAMFRGGQATRREAPNPTTAVILRQKTATQD
jgi:hypothetical protein